MLGLSEAKLEEKRKELEIKLRKKELHQLLNLLMQEQEFTCWSYAIQL